MHTLDILQFLLVAQLPVVAPSCCPSEGFTSEDFSQLSMASQREKLKVWESGFAKTGPNVATCVKCQPPKDFAYRGGTSNLRNHLRDVHKINLTADDTSSANKKQAGGIAAFFKPAKISSVRAASCGDRIVEFVCRDLRPISIVTGEGFLSLMHFLEPGFVVPSATQVTKLIRRKHEAGLKLLIEKLKPVNSVALTTDLWTSRRTEGYITLCMFPVHHTACGAFTQHHFYKNVKKLLVSLVYGM